MNKDIFRYIRLAILAFAALFLESTYGCGNSYTKEYTKKEKAFDLGHMDPIKGHTLGKSQDSDTAKTVASPEGYTTILVSIFSFA